MGIAKRPSLEELQKSRGFVGQDDETRSGLEEQLKSRYEISNWKSDDKYIHAGGVGYKIHDKQKGVDTYFSPNARLTLEKRYLEKGNKRQVVETALDLFARVAVNIAEADLKYNPSANVKPIAEGFLESLLYKHFMPNTPTLCNAGRKLQQLSACFVLPVADYLATDDIGEDPEKQGNGIMDSARYMSMIHKSGGGTGFNFSHLRPRSDMIATTFGTSSGPTSFIGIFDAITNAVNQGGFRRGANMGILNYNHPDIFEFTSIKARTGTLTNFNLSVGVTNEFMQLVEEERYFKMYNPKGETKQIPLEKRVWKADNLLQKGTVEYETLHKELEPSLIISEDGKEVINTYTEKKVGKVNGKGEILISAKSLFDYIAENAWIEGCPGIVFLDRLEENNTTSHIAPIEATNPCGEQPLPSYEACNLLGVNLLDCYTNGADDEFSGPGGLEKLFERIDWGKVKARVREGVHFLDNVIDMSKFPFKKIYGYVHGNRRIGLGLMGWAEMLSGLGIQYNSDEAVALAARLSSFVTEEGTKMSEELAKTRDTFPNWQGSTWEKEGREVRNATITTIAPNGTTAMIADCTGGIEPYFRVAFTKTCMDNTKLNYRIPKMVKELREAVGEGEEFERIMREVDKKGTLEGIEGIPNKIRLKYKTSHVISAQDHVRVQGAFQKGEDGKEGVHNAVSKTVNMPEGSTIEDVKKAYWQAFREESRGVTVFREGSKKGVLGGLEKQVDLVQFNVKAHPLIEISPQAIKYRIKRPHNKDSLHITLTGDLYVNDDKNKAYFLPTEMFQNRVPLGDAKTITFAQAGIDRTEILKGPNPDYAEMIKRLQSPTSSESEGVGFKKIKSIEHAAGLILEDYCLRNGIVWHDEKTKQLVNVVEKAKLRKVEAGTEEYNSLMSQVRVSSEGEQEVMGINGKLSERFECEDCHSTQYTFIAGCHHPVCKQCGWVFGGGCG